MNRTGKYITCEYCGNIVYKTLSQYNKRKHHFCSNKCQSLLKRNLTYEYRSCEMCGKEYYIQKKSTKRFCSVQCQNEWQKLNTGFRNPKFEGDYVYCEYCGDKHIVGKYRLENTKHHFCSQDCRRHWYAEVWSQSEEWRTLSRKRAVHILANNRSTTQTKPQIIINTILNEMGIAFINEYAFVYYSVDNYLPDYNLIIEVMGDYWHTSPIKFPYPKNDIQKHIISRDKAKHTYIKNQHAIEILYIWESDITDDQDLCRKLISLYINKSGKLSNYHSFNYTLDDNGNLQLIQSIIIPHQDAC